MIKNNNLRRSIIKTLVYILILFFVIISAGIAYTWYINKDTVNVVDETSDAPVSSVPKVIQLTVAPNSPVGASVQSLSSPVSIGEPVYMTVKTRQYADCSIVVEYNNVPSKDPRLGIVHADEYGMVSWEWSVPEGTPAGKWPVKVTCKYGEKSGYVEGKLLVKA